MLTLSYLPAWYGDQSQDDDHEIPLDRNYYEFHEVWDDIFGDHWQMYHSSGYRMYRDIDLTELITYKDSTVTWDADEPDGTSVTFEARINDEDYTEVKNGGKLPITNNSKTKGMTLCTRQVLRTSDYAETPELNEVTIEIKGERETYRMNGDKVGLIRHREIELDEDGKGSEEWDIEGPDLKGIVAQRKTIPPDGEDQDRLEAPAETIMKQWVRNNLVEPEDEKRKIPNLTIATDQERGPTLERGTRHENLKEELESLSKYTDLGWNIYIDFENEELVFDVYEGTDRTADQDDNPRVIFSPEFDTLSELHYVDSKDDYRNVAYVGGQGEGDDREIVEVGDTDAEGLDRYETFVDARDEEDSEVLEERGEEELADHEEEEMLEGEMLAHSTFRYQRDYDLGDKVTIQHKGWNLEVDTPIIGITETFESDGYSLEGSFGKDIPTLISKIKREL